MHRLVARIRQRIDQRRNQQQYEDRIARETRQVNQRLQLPVEILVDILAYIKDRQTLATLCRVSRTFISIVIPILYRVVPLELDLLAIGYRVELCKAISKQPLSAYIVKFDVTLLNGVVHMNGDRRRFSYELNPRKCRRMERTIEKISNGLPNLEVLWIYCEFSIGHTTTLAFLARLSTKHLKELCVRCRCRRTSIDATTIFSAPCMQNITSLGWRCPPSWTPREQSLDNLLANTTILPALSGVSLYSSSGIPEQIVYSRPVTRIDIRFFDGRVARQARHHMANLTHLNAEAHGWHERNLLRTFLKEIVPQLRRVRFLGQLLVDQGPVESTFEDLKCLAPTLVFLHLGHWHSTWLPHEQMMKLLPHIESLFPNLRMILQQNRDGLVRRNAGDWVYSKKATFDPYGWQILGDGLEEALL